MMTRPGYPQAMSDIFAFEFKQWTDLKEKMWEYTHFVDERKSNGAYEFAIEWGGLQGAILTPENQITQYSDPVQGGSCQAVHLEYRTGTQVSYRMVQDDKSGLVKQLPSMHTQAHKFTREQVFFNYCFSNGFTTSTGCDGQSIYNSAHALLGGASATSLLPLPSSAFSTAGTYPNSFATPKAPSVSAVQAMMQIQHRMINGMGIPCASRVTTIVHPAEQEEAWKVILGSGYDPSTGNNAVNPITTYGLKLFRGTYLPSATQWWAVGDKADTNLILWEREAVNDDCNDLPQVKAMFIQMSQIFSVMVPVWYNLFGSNA